MEMKEKEPQTYAKLIEGYADNRHVFMSEGGMYLYHIGIIDYL